MKKLLSIACCATAALAVSSASAEDTTSTTIATVGVMSITVPAGQANTIIAAAFKDLSDTTKDVSIANIVKTTGLSAGDKLMLFTGGNQPYSVWTLKDTDGTKTWEKATKTYYVDSTGAIVEGTGTAASDTTAAAGTGLWLIRTDTSAEATITLYGAYNSAAKTTTTAAGAWNLIGNAGLADFSNFTGEKGDQIITVESGALRRYQYDGSNWSYETGKVSEQKVTLGGKEMTLIKNETVTKTPAIAPGVGFWYYTQSAQTLTWSDETAN